MTNDEIEQSLKETLDLIEKHRKTFQDQVEKFRVALSGTLRLLVGKDDSILTRLRGNPEDVAGYLIRIFEETFTDTLERINQISSMVNSIRDSVRKQ